MDRLPSRRQLIEQAKVSGIKYYGSKSKEELCNLLGYDNIIPHNNPKLNNKLNRLKPTKVKFVNVSTGDCVVYNSLYEANKLTGFPVNTIKYNIQTGGVLFKNNGEDQYNVFQID